MGTNQQNKLPNWLPFLAGTILVIQFAALGVWQISRGVEKRADRTAFNDQTQFADFSHGLAVRPYQALEATGQLDTRQQFLLDNIIVNSRHGYYVLTALEIADDEPLLIVNRGWIEKTERPPEEVSIAVPETTLTVRGRAGALPRPGYRMGDAILSTDGWPQIAVYPNLDELEQSLSREVQPFVLLMDPADEHGFLRHWVPEEMGPGKHFGYALQWFAMGAVLAGLLIWNFRKRKPADE